MDEEALAEEGVVLPEGTVTADATETSSTSDTTSTATNATTQTGSSTTESAVEEVIAEVNNEIVIQETNVIGTIINEGILDVSSAGEEYVTSGSININAVNVVNAGEITAGGDITDAGGTININAMEEILFTEESVVSADNGVIDLTAGGVVEVSGNVEASGDSGKISISSGSEINSNADINASEGEVSLDAEGSIVSHGSLKAETLNEKGGAFDIGGNYEVGNATVENKDGAINLSTGNYSGTTSDIGDIIVNAGAVITLTGDTVFSADSDADNAGIFDMQVGASIIGGGFNLDLYSASTNAATVVSNSDLYSITGINNFNLYKSGASNCVYNSDTASSLSVTSFTINSGVFKRFAGGDGTAPTPYQIVDVYGLQGVNTLLSSNFILNNNIDASGTVNWNGGLGFDPLGDNVSAFTGDLNGNNFEVSNITINRPLEIFVGLIGFASGSAISNIGVSGNVTGGSWVGGIAGDIILSTISNSYNATNVIGSTWVGGIAGYNNMSTISYSYNTGDISGGTDVGGISGVSSSGANINNSYNTGTISGNDEIAGICGYNNQSSISYSYNTGNITGSNMVGGVVGNNFHNSTITYSYNTGNISGDDCIGGVTGYNSWTSSITKTYSIGQITGNTNYGGLVGNESIFFGANTYTDNFWNYEAAGLDQTRDIGGDDVNNNIPKNMAGITGITTVQSRAQGAYTNWDFSVVGDGTIGNWIMAGTPHLQMEHTTTINDVVDLQLMAVDLTESYTLNNNIDASGTVNWNGGNGFDPIGDLGGTFTGTFDGMNYDISDLYVNRPAEDNTGLFGYIDGAVIQNVGLININIIGGNDTGGLVGISNNSSSVIKSHAEGIVTGGFETGGLVGYSINGSSITNSYAEGSVAGSGRTGGLVGSTEWGSSINNCYANSTVTSTGDFNGGLLGYAFDTVTISNSYFSGSVAGTGDYTGGFGGFISIAAISKCFSSAVVSGTTNVGGFIGLSDTSGGVNTYADNYWNYQISTLAQTRDIGGTNDVQDVPQDIAGITGITNAQSLNQATFTGFDFTVAGDGTIGNWIMAGTPHLQMEHNFMESYTSSGVYEVSSLTDLQLMAVNLNANYEMQNNIDASATTTWNAGAGFDPVGTAAGYFLGNFDGNDFDISNLYINRAGEDFNGLFGYIRYSDVENVGIVNANIRGRNSTGALIGDMWFYSNVTNCHSSGTVIGYDRTGGLIGDAFNQPTIQNSYSSAVVSGHNYVAGLVGVSNGSPIENCYSTGNVSGNDNVGGIAGTNYSRIESSYSTGNISGHNSVGGIAGDTSNLSSNLLINVYATGTVSGNDYVGGLLGNSSGGTVTDSYFKGNVTATLSGGQMVGAGTTRLVNSYYNYDTILLNGSKVLSKGALYNAQYIDWDETVKSLNIADYASTLSLNNGYYEINSVQGLKDILGFADNASYKFRLSSDIDMAGNSNVYIPYFSADEFDGNGFKIMNLHITGSRNNVGFFGQTYQSVINNMVIQNANVSGNNSVGALVGYNEQTTINNSYSTGSISGSSSVGGLIGFNGFLVTDCFSSANVTSTGSAGGVFGYSSGDILRVYFDGTISGVSYVGGIAGQFWGNTLQNSYNLSNISGTDYVGGITGYNGTFSDLLNNYSSGDVTGNNYIGGIAGYNSRGTLGNNFNIGDINGNDYVGGLTGYNYRDAVISNNYSTGNVSGNNYVGGAIGYNYRTTNTTNNYSAGSVTGTTNYGGFVGYDNASSGANTYTNNFWNYETAGLAQTRDIGGTNVANNTPQDVANLTGITSALSDNQATYTGWDFAGTWGILEDVTNPYLRWRYTGISGSVYGDSGVTAVGAGVDVSLTLNGTMLTTVSTNANGSFAVLVDAMAAGDALLAYINDNEVYKGNLLNTYDGSNATGYNIYGNNTVIARGDNGAISNTTFSTAKGVLADADILYSLSGLNLTLSTGNDLLVWTGDTYTPGGNITTNDLTISAGATLNAGTNTINIAGDWTANGIFDAGTSSVNFNGGSISNITSGGVDVNHDFNNINIQNGTTLNQTQAVLTANLDIVNGIYDLNGQDLTVSNTFSNNGLVRFQGNENAVITMDSDSGTAEYYGAGNYAGGLAGGNDYNNLNITGTGTFNQIGNLLITNDFIQSDGIFNSDSGTDSFSVENSFEISGGVFNRYAGGDGSLGNPYQINDIYGFQGINTNLLSNYSVTSNIDASGAATWNGGLGFNPIGDNVNPFTGTLNG
ncbi:MAG: filamentous hemagglutinin outer membrane protein, partial [uncultured bacterium]